MELLVRKHAEALVEHRPHVARVVDRTQHDLVDVEELAKLLRQVKLQPAVDHLQLVAGDEDRLAAARRQVCAVPKRQAKGRPGVAVGDEVPPLPVEGVEERARADLALALLDLDALREPGQDLALLHAVGPAEQDGVHDRALAEAEAEQAVAAGRADAEVAGEELHTGPDAELVRLEPARHEVDPAHRPLRPRHEEIEARVRHQEQVAAAVAVEVRADGLDELARQIDPLKRLVVDHAVAVEVEEGRALTDPLELAALPFHNVEPNRDLLAQVVVHIARLEAVRGARREIVSLETQLAQVLEPGASGKQVDVVVIVDVDHQRDARRGFVHAQLLGHFFEAKEPSARRRLLDDRAVDAVLLAAHKDVEVPVVVEIPEHDAVGRLRTARTELVAGDIDELPLDALFFVRRVPKDPDAVRSANDEVGESVVVDVARRRRVELETDRQPGCLRLVLEAAAAPRAQHAQPVLRVHHEVAAAVVVEVGRDEETRGAGLGQ